MTHRKNLYFGLALGNVLLLASGGSRLSAEDPSSSTRWDFGTEATRRLIGHGSVRRDQSGPKPPEFTDFDIENTAIRLDKPEAYLSMADPGSDSNLDFTNGDAITIEAWVNPDFTTNSAPAYVIGKGRTGNPRMARDNQNWALRLVTTEEATHVSFLFATKRGSGNSHWHRWTSDLAFPIDQDQSGWHSIAITYRFGEPDSIVGWIDGQSSDGQWDLGGKTTQPPVVDDDEVWIGSARAGNSFVGSLDAIAIHRRIRSDDVMASRFKRTGARSLSVATLAVMPVIDTVPSNRVLVTFAEGLSSSTRWPDGNQPDNPYEVRWTGGEFLLPRIPIRYDDWGIRDAWDAPVRVRMAADVEFMPGTHRLLMRTRGLGRLWIDGNLIASNPPSRWKSADGSQPMTPVPKPPTPSSRVHGYHQQEVFSEIKITGAPIHRVVLEIVVGGKGQRTETGEVCVAIQWEGTDSFVILKPSNEDPLRLSDVAVEAAIDRMEDSLTALDDQTRRSAAASQDAFWNRRHQQARQWARDHANPASVAPNTNLGNPIDHWIARKISKAVDASAQVDANVSNEFHRKVLPILRDQCFRCHGEKRKGDLKLNSRASVRMAGESELPAVVPGDPDASELMEQVRSGAMPPTETGLRDEQITILERWIREGALWPAPPVSAEQIALSPIIDEEAFLRRVYLDTVGVPPTAEEAEVFLQDSDPEKRVRLVDRLLQDPRLADHSMGEWQDLLAENPTLLNQSLNSTGPFRWFLYDSLRDHKPLDRMITELILMRGNPDTGGSAGFAMAGENDAPFAAKAHIVASAFLGMEMQCARCHDSPYHSTTQRDLYALAAMLERKTVTVPATSRVPDAFFEKVGRESLIRVTLKPDEPIEPSWSLAEITGVQDGSQISLLMMNPDDTRERLATLITAPQNLRFGRVIVNRLWKRLMGAGLVEPTDDWEGQSPSHPELIDGLVRELIEGNYDLRHVMRQIMTSKAYMREATGNNLATSSQQRFFNAPDRRRLSAEQIVDSLHVVTGNAMDAEEMTFVHDGHRSIGKRQSLGKPNRAWMFASLNNERDRPSLSLPKARAITDVLQAFGWNGSRQEPTSQRDQDPNILQPGILANGTLTMTLTRAAYQSDLANLAIHSDSPESLVDRLFLRILTRLPQPDERTAFVNAIGENFEHRLNEENTVPGPESVTRLPLVTWFNHLRPEANTIQLEQEQRVEMGPPPDGRFDPTWRAVYEDMVWSLVNHREFVWIP